MDLMAFGAVPAQIWTEFSKLETLTIALYPFEVIKDIDHLENEDGFMPQNPEFVFWHASYIVRSRATHKEAKARPRSKSLWNGRYYVGLFNISFSQSIITLLPLSLYFFWSPQIMQSPRC